MARAAALALGGRGRLVLLLVLAMLVSLAVGGTCDNGRRRLREETQAEGGWVEPTPPPLSPNATTETATLPTAMKMRTNNNNNDDSLLPPPSNPELTLLLTTSCTQCSTPTNKKSCVADIAQDCDASVNYQCPSCGLWRNVKECLATVTKRDCGGQGPPVYYSPANAVAPRANTWLVQPLEPLQGVENFMRSNAGPAAAACWEFGWTDAIQGTTERPQINARDLTVMINSLQARSMASAHFHVGSNTAAWGACVRSLPLPAQGVWWRASCKSISARTGQVTELKYLWPSGGRANVNAAATEGLRLFNNSPTAGVALVGYPGKGPDDNLVIVYDDGVGDVSEYTLLNQ